MNSGIAALLGLVVGAVIAIAGLVLGSWLVRRAR